MRLGIDLDGVVANFTAGWIRRYNSDFGTGLVSSDVVTWGAMIDITHFSSMDEFWEWSAGGNNRPSVFRHLEPYPGSVEALRHLQRGGHDIVVLTTKPDFAVHDTLHWIADVELPTREIHVTEDKAAVACEVYLEDAPHQLAAIAAARPQATVCRFVRPWNAPLGGTKDVTSWPEFVALVDSIE